MNHHLRAGCHLKGTWSEFLAPPTPYAHSRHSVTVDIYFTYLCLTKAHGYISQERFFSSQNRMHYPVKKNYLTRVYIESTLLSLLFTCWLSKREALTVLCSVVKYEEAARARKKCGEKHETYSSVSPHFLIVNRWLMITLLAYHDSTYNINHAFLFQTSSPLNQWYFTNNIRLVLIFHLQRQLRKRLPDFSHCRWH